MSLTYNPYFEDFRKDPWPLYRRMRDEQPAYYIEDLGAWALSRFQDVWDAGMDRKSYTATHGTPPGPLLMKEDVGPGGFFGFMDAPEHSRYRDLIAPRYGRTAVRELEEATREQCRQILQPHLDTGELDVYRIAHQLAVHTIAGVLGLQYEDVKKLRAWIDIFYHREPGQAGTTAAGGQAMTQIQAYVMGLIAEFRANPPPESTHIGTWLRAEIDGQRMSDPQIFFNIFVFIVTGTDTFPIATAGAIYYLSEIPQQLAEVRADLALIPQVFDESARFDHPTNILGRTLLCDVELHGKTLRKGQPVIFLYASANRDEREFADPDKFLIHRRPKRTLVFGAGAHACVGNALAKMEARVLLEELFSAIPEFETHRDRSRRVFGEFFQGWCSVPIGFKPR